MPRFVILSHDHPFPHFDLMLEAEGKLRTWRLLDVPTSQHEIQAESLGDHRIDYLDYEGPVSGGRGRVVRWDAGSYEVCEESPEKLIVQLASSRCHGTGNLRRVDGSWIWRWHHSRGD
jgi:hypothetical protein